nr:PAS domain S-box protein [Desulfobacula sp.]
MLETALDHSPAGIIITDTHDAAIRWANPEALRILGQGLLFCPADQGMAPDGDWQAFRPDGTPYAPEDLPLSRAMTQGEIIRNQECIIRNAEGHEKWISSNAAPVRDANGFVSAGILIFEDISERKQSEDALIKSEALLKLIIEHTSAYVSIHDSEGNYIFASPSHGQLGFKPEELVGQSGFSIITGDDTEILLERLDQAKRKEISEAFLDYKVRDKGGKIHYLRGSFNAVFKPGGDLERIICVGEDISELRKAQAEKLRPSRWLLKPKSSLWWARSPEKWPMILIIPWVSSWAIRNWP